MDPAERLVEDPALLGALVRAIRPAAWMADGLCQEYPEIEFFPGKGQSVDPARDVCSRCLVRDECATFALERDLPGIWGGLSERARRQLRTPADSGLVLSEHAA